MASVKRPQTHDRADGPRTAAHRTVAALAESAQNHTIRQGMLAEGARLLLQGRMKIAQIAPKGLFRDTAWDMMLELFISEAEGGIVYVKHIMLASGESPAAAMRRIDRLEHADFICRTPDPFDMRRVVVCLTDRGRQAMTMMLTHLFEVDENKPVPPVGYAASRRR